MIVNVVGTAVVVAIAIAIGLYMDKKFRVTLKPDGKPNHGNIETAGDTPATAVRAGDAQLANLRAGQRCKACRARLESDRPDEELRYADRTLLLLTFHCPACSRNRSLYVEPTA